MLVIISYSQALTSRGWFGSFRGWSWTTCIFNEGPRDSGAGGPQGTPEKHLWGTMWHPSADKGRCQWPARRIWTTLILYASSLTNESRRWGRNRETEKQALSVGQVWDQLKAKGQHHPWRTPPTIKLEKHYNFPIMVEEQSTLGKSRECWHIENILHPAGH